MHIYYEKKEQNDEQQDINNMQFITLRTPCIPTKNFTKLNCPKYKLITPK